MRTSYSPIETNRLPLLTDWKSRGDVFDKNDGGDDYFDAYDDNNYNDYRLPLLTDWKSRGDYFDDHDGGGDGNNDDGSDDGDDDDKGIYRANDDHEGSDDDYYHKTVW